MFDKKEIEAYQNISAPDDLRERVLSACEEGGSGKRGFAGMVRMLSALAACFVLVAVFSVFAIGNFGTFSVSVDGKTLTENGMTLAANEGDVAPLAMRMLSGKEVPLLFRCPAVPCGCLIPKQMCFWHPAPRSWQRTM